MFHVPLGNKEKIKEKTFRNANTVAYPEYVPLVLKNELHSVRKLTVEKDDCNIPAELWDELAGYLKDDEVLIIANKKYTKRF